MAYLEEIKDDSENWSERKFWLQDLLAELWKNRGAYPGMSSLLSHLGFNELIQFFYEQFAIDKEKEAVRNIFEFLNDRTVKSIDNCTIDNVILENYRKHWHVKLRENHRDLSELVLSRINLSSIQVCNILSSTKEENGLYSSIEDILNDPYILSEEYVGDDLNDEISFAKVDHGIIPSPDLGIANLYPKEDWRRLRGLMVDQLRKETVHSFVNQDVLLSTINKRLAHYPDWKREEFNEGFIDYDRTEFEIALEFVKEEESGLWYVYQKHIKKDEEEIGSHIKGLIGRGDITLSKPFSAEKWKNELYKSDTPLAKKAPEEYKTAIEGQIEVCSRIFNKPLSIVAGSAGTGKTTIIKAVINAIRFTSGNSESFCLLAPTGKAADRIREKTGETATTIHGFLTRNGWMNPNFTLKKTGGKKEDKYSTIIIDESSMIDLQLMAALFRAINWNYIHRLILVGDPNQLPPIGKGKVFSDIIEYLIKTNPEAYGKLKNNVRQLENTATNQGTGIIDLASLYIRDNIKTDEIICAKQKAETLLKEIQESDEDVRPDLRIVSWEDTDELESKIVESIKKDMESDQSDDIMDYQIISPYRGELFGTEHLNVVVQKAVNGHNIDRKGNLAGVTAYDKVIQFTNRAGHNSYYSYNMSSRQKERVEVFNGEMGKTRPHNFDLKMYRWGGFRLRKLQATFERKPNNFIDFNSDSEVENNLELGYAISVHKAQGSEFKRIYFVLPKNKQSLLSTELLYTGITRAQKHLTVFMEGDFRTLITMRRPEKSRLSLINSSVFEFNPIHEDLLSIRSWYEEGKIHKTLAEFMVRSKSEVIVSNMLFENGIEDVEYEKPLFAKDGTFFLPDFTIHLRGKTYFWEHLGMLNIENYKKHWEVKEKWYNDNFPGQLVTTEEASDLSHKCKELIHFLLT